MNKRIVRGLYFAFLLLLSLPGFTKDLPDFTDIVEKQGVAVVNISTSVAMKRGKQSVGPENDPAAEFLRRLFPQQLKDNATQSLGSGFLISSDGYILTNAHVLEGVDEITVRLTDKREFKAKVIGVDRRVDIGLLKINATLLPKVTFGDPDRLKVGEWVLAIGMPFGIESSVAAGIVSAKGRTLPDDTYVPFVQTDFTVTPGSSGGPLLNLRGEVVGVNTQTSSNSIAYAGLSFVIPIDVAMEVANQLKTGGKLSHAKLGVAIQNVSKDIAESLGLDRPTGALITNVEKGAAADKAGLKPGDVILSLNSKPITMATDLPRMVGNAKAGTKLQMQVWRAGTSKEYVVMLGESAEEKDRPLEKIRSVKVDALNRIGLGVVELTTLQRKQLDLIFGLLVTEVQAPGIKAGLEEGDIIIGVNNEGLKSLAQFNQIIEKTARGAVIALLVKRDDSTLFIPIRVTN